MKGKLYYKLIKDKRNELDLTQKQICEELNIPLDEYKKMESGEFIPPKKHLKKICDYLKLNIDEIYMENFRDTKVISVMSNKGGVGKTSVTGSVSFCLAELGYKVLCIDADMQGNLTHSFNLETDEDKNLAVALKNEIDIKDCILKSEYNNLDFVVYNSALSAIDMLMFTKNAREYIFKRILTNTINEGIYDFIVIDTNPSLSILNFNVINVTNYCIVPVQLGAFGLEGIGILLNFIDDAKQFNSDFVDYKLVINNYDSRKSITKKSHEWLKENYGDILLNSMIRVDTNIENAQVENMPVLEYNSSCRISKEFRELTKEILKIVK